MSDQALGATIILALSELTDIEREVVVARHMHGKSAATIAAKRGTDQLLDRVAA